MTKLNQVQLEKNLNEVSFPISKKDLIKYAEEKGVDEKILRTFRKIPFQEYDTPMALSAAIDNVE